jgi:hypothetical protein
MQLLHYDPVTGVFTRVRSVRGQRSSVGSVRPDGYLSICVDYRSYLAHRLVWLYMHGVFPEYQIDHFNGDRLDNRIANLRQVTNKQNCENSKLYSRNKTGARGVRLDPRTGRYVVRIRHFGEDIHIGVRDTVEQASQLARSARDELFTHHKTPHSS